MEVTSEDAAGSSDKGARKRKKLSLAWRTTLLISLHGLTRAVH